MILEDAFYAEIQLKKGNVGEFVEQGWYALNVHKIYPNEKIGADAFFDWARDLSWVKEKCIVIVIKGILDNETRETIDFLNEYWDTESKEIEKPEYWKDVYFIIAG